MSATTVTARDLRPVQSDRRQAVFTWTVVTGALSAIGLTVISHPHELADPKLLAWVAVIIAIELFQIPTWGGAQFTVSDPLFIALAVGHSPLVVIAVVFVSACDPREFRRQVSFQRAIWNRSQLALSMGLGCLVLQAISGPQASFPRLLVAAIAGTAVYYAANVSAVACRISFAEGIPFKKACRGLLLDAPFESALGYLSFAALGVLIARLVALAPEAEWVIPAFAFPLVFLARSTFLHIRSARREADASEQRAALMRAVSDRVAKERGDERSQLAGLLHDDAIPEVEGINLTANIALASLEAGRVEAATGALSEIRESSLRSASSLRQVVGDLRRTPLEGRSLTEALQELAKTWAMGPPVMVQAEDVDVPDAAQLLLFQIAHEAAANAVKHSRGRQICIVLRMDGSHLELSVSDDGRGIDGTPEREGHFGLTLMRERAEALSGELTITSAPDGGTRLSFGCRWLDGEGRKKPGTRLAITDAGRWYLLSLLLAVSRSSGNHQREQGSDQGRHAGELGLDTHYTPPFRGSGEVQRGICVPGRYASVGLLVSDSR